MSGRGCGRRCDLWLCFVVQGSHRKCRLMSAQVVSMHWSWSWSFHVHCILYCTYSNSSYCILCSGVCIGCIVRMYVVGMWYSMYACSVRTKLAVFTDRRQSIVLLRRVSTFKQSNNNGGFVLGGRRGSSLPLSASNVSSVKSEFISTYVESHPLENRRCRFGNAT
jgi:hypothetical protein